MKKLLSLFLFVIGCTTAQELWAQSGMDTLMKEPAVNCDDVKYNASVLIPQFLREGELESAMEAHQFWTNNCAASEMSNLVGYMLNLLQDGKMDNVTDQELIVTLLNSDLGLQEEHSGSYYFYNQTEENIPLVSRKRFIDFLTEQAFKFQDTQFPEGSKEDIFLKFIKEDRIDATHDLRVNRENNESFQSIYNERATDLLSRQVGLMTLRSGVWVPQGNASVLGLNPVIGFSLGGTFRKMDMLSVVLEGRIGASISDSLNIMYKDSLITTDYVSGLYVGFEYDKRLLSSKNFRHRLGLTLGLGYDHVNVIPEYLRGVDDGNTEDEVDINPRKYLPSINVNVGLSYSYRMTMGSYLGWNARFNYHNYNNKGGDNLTGTSINANVVIGFLFNDTRWSEGEKLGLAF
jgi:hypothetical protein